MLRKLHTIADRVHDVTYGCTNPCRGVYPFLMDDSLAGKIDILTVFYGPILPEGASQPPGPYAPTTSTWP